MRKPQKKHLIGLNQQLEEKTLESLVQCIIEDLNQCAVKVQDPFENYTYRLRMRINSDREQFTNRVIDGYKTLLQEISSKKNS